MSMLQTGDFEPGDIVSCIPGIADMVMMFYRLQHDHEYRVVKYISNPFGENKLKLVDVNNGDEDMGMVEAALFMKKDKKRVN